MIHLILVSHSLALAEGIYQLATQMSNYPDSIHLAAGIDDEENPIGTDAVKIMAAIEAADNPDGMLILVDLGSALLSAETALDLIDPEVAQRCKISSAPLAEGAIAAAIMAGTGADLATVAQAAEGALQGKQAALQVEEEATEPMPKIGHFDAKATIVLSNPHGLHARPAALLVSKMNAFHSQIWLEKGRLRADGKNINQILALHSRVGDQITFYATGEDAEKAKITFQQLAAEHFGEYISPKTQQTLATAAVLRAKTIKGMVFRPQERLEQKKDFRIHHLQQAIQIHKCHLSQFSEEVAAWLGEEYGAIFTAQKMLLAEIAEEALQVVHEWKSISAGWREFCHSQAALLERVDNPYFQARAADILDLENAVSLQLNGSPLGLEIPTQPCIYVTNDIFPSQVWKLSQFCMENSLQWYFGAFCKAIVLAKGNPLGHAVILLQALNIPVLLSAGEEILMLKTGENIILDLDTGTIAK